ncbi:MAG: hypothetical protein L0H55_02410 [Candidatus Nitrosocosmicus sp.]|nr:hypothetical protein [Candidatus Nitrosocosmicus sp.]
MSNNQPQQNEEQETVTIPKSELIGMNNQIANLTKKLVEIKQNLDYLSGALIQIQASVHNTKNSI